MEADYLNFQLPTSKFEVVGFGLAISRLRVGHWLSRTRSVADPLRQNPEPVVDERCERVEKLLINQRADELIAEMWEMIVPVTRAGQRPAPLGLSL